MEKEYVSPLLTRPAARSRGGRTGTSGDYEEDTGMLKLESSDQNVEDIITQIQSRGQQGGM